MNLRIVQPRTEQIKLRRGGEERGGEGKGGEGRGGNTKIFIDPTLVIRP